MPINVYVLVSTLDQEGIQLYHSLHTLSKHKKFKGKITVKKVNAESEMGEDLLEQYEIEDTPAVIVRGEVIAEGAVPENYLREILEELVEEDVERTTYFF